MSDLRKNIAVTVRSVTRFSCESDPRIVGFTGPVMTTIPERGGRAVLGVALSAVAETDVVVRFSVRGGVYGRDYTLAQQGGITIPQGQTVGAVVVFGVDDDIVEADTIIRVHLEEALGATLSEYIERGVRITSEDSLPVVGFRDVRTTVEVPESGPVSIPLALSRPVEEEVRVEFDVAGPAASRGVVSPDSRVIIFPPNTTEQEITVFGDDPAGEIKQVMVLVLRDPVSATLGERRIQGAVFPGGVVAPGPPEISIASLPTRIPERNGVALVEGFLSHPHDQDTEITWAFTGTATPGTDYRSPTSNPYLITAGNVAFRAVIRANEDSFIENDETVITTILSATNGVTVGASDNVVTTIYDTTESPQIAGFLTPNSSVPEGDNKEFIVGLTRPATETTYVDFEVVPGVPPMSTSEYSVRPGGYRLRFDPGDSSKTITVLTNEGSVPGTPEQVILRLTGATGAVLGTVEQSERTLTVVHRGALTRPGEVWHNDEGDEEPAVAPTGENPFTWAMDQKKAELAAQGRTSFTDEDEVIHVYVASNMPNGDTEAKFIPVYPPPFTANHNRYIAWWGEAMLVLHGQGPHKTKIQALPISISTHSLTSTATLYGVPLAGTNFVGSFGDASIWLDRANEHWAGKVVFVGIEIEMSDKYGLHSGQKNPGHLRPSEFVRVVGCNFVDNKDPRPLGPTFVDKYVGLWVVSVEHGCFGAIRCHAHIARNREHLFYTHDTMGFQEMTDTVVSAVHGQVWQDVARRDEDQGGKPVHLMEYNGNHCRQFGHGFWHSNTNNWEGSGRIMRITNSVYLDIDRGLLSYVGGDLFPTGLITMWDGGWLEGPGIVRGFDNLREGYCFIGLLIENCFYASYQPFSIPGFPQAKDAGDVSNARAIRIENNALYNPTGFAIAHKIRHSAFREAAHGSRSRCKIMSCTGNNTPAIKEAFLAMEPELLDNRMIDGQWRLGLGQEPIENKVPVGPRSTDIFYEKDGLVTSVPDYPASQGQILSIEPGRGVLFVHMELDAHTKDYVEIQWRLAGGEWYRHNSEVLLAEEMTSEGPHKFKAMIRRSSWYKAMKQVPYDVRLRGYTELHRRSIWCAHMTATPNEGLSPPQNVQVPTTTRTSAVVTFEEPSITTGVEYVFTLARVGVSSSERVVPAGTVTVMFEGLNEGSEYTVVGQTRDLNTGATSFLSNTAHFRPLAPLETPTNFHIDLTGDGNGVDGLWDHNSSIHNGLQVNLLYGDAVETVGGELLVTDSSGDPVWTGYLHESGINGYRMWLRNPGNQYYADGTILYFQIRARDGERASEWSGIWQITKGPEGTGVTGPYQGGGGNPPPTPTNFTATAGDGEVSVDWS